MTYNIGNPDHGLGQAGKCGRVKLIFNLYFTPLYWYDMVWVWTHLFTYNLQRKPFLESPEVQPVIP